MIFDGQFLIRVTTKLIENVFGDLFLVFDAVYLMPNRSKVPKNHLHKFFHLFQSKNLNAEMLSFEYNFSLIKLKIHVHQQIHEFGKEN